MSPKVITVIGDKTDPEERIRLEWGQSLTERMKSLNVTSKVLRHRLAELGVVVTRQAIESWMAGKTAPRPYHQAAIGTCLFTDARHLFPLTNLPKAG